MPEWAWCRFHKKRVGTRYVELVISHPVGSAGHVVHYVASTAQNIDALFQLLGWVPGGIHKKCIGTRYSELMFLHMVGFASHVVHSGASAA
jgi:hypothetical protein